MTAPVDTKAVFEKFGDLFSEFFADNQATGGDLSIPLQLTLADVEGVERDVEVRRTILCADCAGRGAPADALSSPCSVCEGKGQIMQVEGAVAFSSQCAICRGRRETFDRECISCNGVGGTERTEKLKVVVPPGVANGHSLRLQGKGNELTTGTGDLFINLEIRSGERIVRNGDDLVAQVGVNAELARTGGAATVSLPDGNVEIEVPPNAHTGMEVRLRGYGLPKLGSPPSSRPTGHETPYRSVDPAQYRGDLIVRFCLEGESDWLGLLGLDRGASPEHIEKAYRRLAEEFHPEQRMGDAQAARRLAQIEAAFAALTDKPSRPRPTGTPMVWWLTGLALFAVAAILVSLLR